MCLAAVRIPSSEFSGNVVEGLIPAGERFWFSHRQGKISTRTAPKKRHIKQDSPILSVWSQEGHINKQMQLVVLDYDCIFDFVSAIK